MPRPSAQEWTHHLIKKDNGKKETQCRHCSMTWAGHDIERGRKHLSGCLSAPANAVTPPSKKRKIDQVESEATAEDILNANVDSTSGAPTVGLSRHVDHISSEEHHRFIKAFAECIFLMGLPFSITENPSFRAFIKLIRPGLTLPSRKKISNKYLDIIYEEYKAKMEKVIKQKKHRHLTLVTDGWTNVHGESIINYMLCTRVGSIFYKSSTTGMYFLCMSSTFI